MCPVLCQQANVEVELPAKADLKSFKDGWLKNVSDVMGHCTTLAAEMR